MYQILLGWKAYTWQILLETVELPNQRKIRLKVAFGPRFSTQQVVFRDLGLSYIGNRLQETEPLLCTYHVRGMITGTYQHTGASYASVYR